MAKHHIEESPTAPPTIAPDGVADGPGIGRNERPSDTETGRADAKATIEGERRKGRAGAANLNRDATVQAYRYAKDHPGSATADAVGLIEGDGAGKGKAGRPKGAKDRPPWVRMSERVQRVLARKSEQWWDKLLNENPYLATQLFKHATPPARERNVPGGGDDSIRVLYVDETIEGKYCRDRSDDDGRALDVQFDTRLDDLEQRNRAERRATAAVDATRASEPTPQPSEVATPHAGDTAVTEQPAQNEQSIASDAPSSAAAILRAARMGDEEARQAIQDAAHTLGLDLQDKANRLAAERRRLAEAERQANRLRMLNDDRCWSN